jgi:predicted RNA binding protein YcfA (HicA-like mRNA interferase family)
MAKFPVDAPKAKVIKVLEQFGFSIVREKEHISMVRKNLDRTTTPLTLPNHKQIGRVLNLWKRVIIVNLKIGVPCYSKQLFAQVVKVRIL